MHSSNTLLSRPLHPSTEPVGLRLLAPSVLLLLLQTCRSYRDIIGFVQLRDAQIDDVVDAFPVHGVNGLWAIIAAGLFGNPDEGIGGNGVFYGGDQLGVQAHCALSELVLCMGIARVHTHTHA